MAKIVRTALLNALGTLVYVVLIALLMSSLQAMFSGAKDIILAPIAMLLLFVFSAAFTGMLVLGKPVLWYLDGKKKEALALFAWTLLFLFTLTVIVFIVMILIYQYGF